MTTIHANAGTSFIERVRLTIEKAIPTNLNKADIGDIHMMHCNECDGGEEHIKQPSDGSNKWVCLWCGHDEIKA